VNPEEWKAEVPLIRAHFAQFGDRLPPKLAEILDQLDASLS